VVRGGPRVAQWWSKDHLVVVRWWVGDGSGWLDGGPKVARWWSEGGSVVVQGWFEGDLVVVRQWLSGGLRWLGEAVKCKFGYRGIQYLDHVISAKGVKANPLNL